VSGSDGSRWARETWSLYGTWDEASGIGKRLELAPARIGVVRSGSFDFVPVTLWWNELERAVMVCFDGHWKARTVECRARASPVQSHRSDWVSRRCENGRNTNRSPSMCNEFS